MHADSHNHKFLMYLCFSGKFAPDIDKPRFKSFPNPNQPALTAKLKGVLWENFLSGD